MEFVEESKFTSELNAKVFQFFSDFMLRVSKFEELGTVGSQLLVGFHQAVEFLRRPPLEKSSKLVEHIIKSNETKRLLSYLEAGCLNIHDSVQNTSKLHTCLLELLDHLNRVKSLVNELECLMEDVTVTMSAASKSLPHAPDKDIDEELYNLVMACGKEEAVSPHLQKPGVTDYAAMLAVIYSMIKKDYTMQEKIVTSLNLKSTSGELETYCLMWSLRPYIDDEIMHQAWKLIPMKSAETSNGI